MWYELLINGYTWFTTQLEYIDNFRIAERIGGELTEGTYTRSEISQIRHQLHDYQTIGVNSRLRHLNRSGIYPNTNIIHYTPSEQSYNTRCLNGSAHAQRSSNIRVVNCPLCLNPKTNIEFWHNKPLNSILVTSQNNLIFGI